MIAKKPHIVLMSISALIIGVAAYKLFEPIVSSHFESIENKEKAVFITKVLAKDISGLSLKEIVVNENTFTLTLLLQDSDENYYTEVRRLMESRGCEILLDDALEIKSINISVFTKRTNMLVLNRIYTEKKCMQQITQLDRRRKRVAKLTQTIWTSH